MVSFVKHVDIDNVLCVHRSYLGYILAIPFLTNSIAAFPWTGVTLLVELMGLCFHLLLLP